MPDAKPWRPALILVDIQKGFGDPRWGTRNNPEAELRAADLLQAWRDAVAPIFHVKHLSRDSSSPLYASFLGSEIQDAVAPLPGEPVLGKDVNSGFIGTGLESRLRARGIEAVVICGLTTDHCVSTTVRMASNLDFKTAIISDATATFDRVGPDGRRWTATVMHDSALASLNREFAEVLTTADAISRLGNAPKKQHPGS